MTAKDQWTADRFAESWNRVPPGSVYTQEQFAEWLSPITQADIDGREVLELGCGNGSLLVHLANWAPLSITGVDLGSSVETCEANMRATGFSRFRIVRHDLTTYHEKEYDLVYCIGVLHHLTEPLSGFESVVRNTRPGGRFHCWVYAREGNAVIIWLVDPIRRIASHLPWWITKYCIATPLALPFFVYGQIVGRSRFLAWLPLAEYCKWICERGFGFFRHVAFDQLVAPKTEYIPRTTIETWLRSTPGIDLSTTYITLRNGNGWKFGGRRHAHNTM